MEEDPAPKEEKYYQNNQCRKHPDAQIDLRQCVEGNHMAMKFDRSQVNGSYPHPVGEELVVQQEETCDTEALGWNKIEE